MDQLDSNSPAAPLAGIRVFELGTSVAAPYATWILGQLGADIVKVERPGKGDDARFWGEQFPDGSSSIFHALNSNKRSVVVDMKNELERDALKALILDRADVVLQNMRPGLIAKYGLDEQSLCSARDTLIYCNIWAFGRDGPLKKRPGYDPLMQAYGGLMSVTGEMGRAPVRAGTSIIDMGTGMWCAIGILAQLQQRHMDGRIRGGVVDTSLYETALGWMTYHITGLQASGNNPVRLGSGAPGMVPYQCYPCSDGYLMVAAPNDKLFALVSEVLGHPQWVDDPRFESNVKRYQNEAALYDVMAPVLARETRAHWQERLEAVGVPCAPEQNTEEMMSDPQTQALKIIQQPEDRGPRLMGIPLSFDGQRPVIHSPAPNLGEHTHDVLGDDPSRTT